MHDPEIESVRAALKGLRTRAGLTVDRLRLTELALTPLLQLEVVRSRQETPDGASPEEAIVSAVRQSAGGLDLTTMLIVDAALALGLTGDRTGQSEIAGGLRANDLSERREFLVSRWADLHELLGADAFPPTPTVRSLRLDLESEAFAELATRLVRTHSFEQHGPFARAGLSMQERPDSYGHTAGGPRILVVGAAVMDHIFGVDHVPAPGTSIQADSYACHAGGKGLNQAVASARLGMDVCLATAIGDDAAGNRLLEFLESEGVDTHLVKVVRGAATPLTAVIVTANGGASVLGWKNESRVRLSPDDSLMNAVHQHIEDSDVVLMTFEPPSETIESILEIVTQTDSRPTTVLTPSPPYEHLRFAINMLKFVDYLVGTQWELRGLLPEPASGIASEDLLRQLLVLGVGNVCIAEHFGSLVRSKVSQIDVPQFPVAFSEAAGARDAFAAALSLRHYQKSGDQLTRSDVVWATAAMAASQSVLGIASAMPTAAEVDHVAGVASQALEDGDVD